jgi:hypothetical protein
MLKVRMPNDGAVQSERSELTGLLRARFDPTQAREVTASYRLVVDGHDSIDINVNDGSLVVQDAPLPAVDVTMTLSQDTLREVLKGADVFKILGENRIQLKTDKLALAQVFINVFRLNRESVYVASDEDLKIIRARAAQNPIEKVERRRGLTVEQFHSQFSSRSIPVIVTDLIPAWPLFKMDLAELKARFGDCVFRQREQSYVEAAFSTKRQDRPIALAEFIDNLSNASAGSLPDYIGNQNVPESMLGLIRKPPYFQPHEHSPPNLWLGPAGTITPFHCDVVDNILAQVWGRKRIQLAPPDEYERVYAERAQLPDVHRAHVDPLNPDLERHPQFRGARVMDVTLEPGEMLFIPSCWFHDVRALTAALSVNFLVSHSRPRALGS